VREEIVPKYKEMLVNLSKGNPFTFEMVRVAVTTGNSIIEVAKEDKSFIGIWQEYIYHLLNDDNGKRYSTSDSYISALNSFQKFLGKDAIKGFNISVAEIQKWKDCMSNALKVKAATSKDKYLMQLLDFTFAPVAPYGISVAVRDICWM
jgi:hypothetical protein